MKLLAFAVYDSKAEAYLRPFFSATRGQAMRSFGDACNDSAHEFHKHAADYTLFYIGAFNEESGMLEPDQMSTLGNALTFISMTPDIRVVQ